jgi:hypothetical protein
MPSVRPPTPSTTNFGEGPFAVARQSATPSSGGVLGRLDASILASGPLCWGESRTRLGVNIGTPPPGNQLLTVFANGTTFENLNVQNPGPGYAASYAAVRIELVTRDPQGAVVSRFTGPDAVAFDARAYFTGFHIRVGESRTLVPIARMFVPAGSNTHDVWVHSYQKVESYGASLAAVSNFTFDFLNVTFGYSPA